MQTCVQKQKCKSKTNPHYLIEGKKLYITVQTYISTDTTQHKTKNYPDCGSYHEHLSRWGWFFSVKPLNLTSVESREEAQTHMEIRSARFH